MRQTKVGGFDQQARQLSNRLDLHLLELFDSVYRMRNLTAAGEALGLSQPAVSRGLARLRDAYDDPLFIRQPRGVLATPLAEHLAAPLAQALAIVHGTVERPIFNPATDTRHFHVSMTDIGERFFLPRLFNHLANVAPAVTVEAVSQSPPELQAGLPSGDIDLVAGFLPALGKQVRRTRLFHERFIYIARQGHPVVQGRLSREQLHDLPHVVASPPGTRHASHVERALASPLVQARVARRLVLQRDRSGGDRDVRQEVEDLAQEVFLSLFADDARALRAWDPTRGLSLSNFVGLVAERQAISILRSGRRSPWRDDPTLDEELDRLPEPRQSETAATSRDVVERLLDRLTEELTPMGRRLFDLLLVEEVPVAEAMVSTGLSAEALYAWRSRLRRVARQLLAELSESRGGARKPEGGRKESR